MLVILAVVTTEGMFVLVLMSFQFPELICL